LISKRLSTAVHMAVVAAAVICSIATTIALIREVPRISIWFADFTVFWTASSFPHPYDTQALTRAQQWLLPSNPYPRPFPYPPSALMLLKPLALLRYTAAIVVWTALGVTAFTAASALYGRKGLAFILSPLFPIAIITGQVSLFIGAAIATAVRLLGLQNILAGLLFGVVGAVKPQIAILVPVILVLGRYWSALLSAVIAGGVMLLASLMLGPNLWPEWVRSLPAFASQVLTPHFRTMNWAPGLWFAPIGACSVWYVFRTTTAPEIRLVSLVSGTCLCLPYIMNYDLVAMAPAAGVLLLRRDWESWVVGFFALGLLWFSPVIVAIGAPYLAYRRERP
jgi:hypothetical protein